MEYIALDVHKNYTWARVENSKGERLYESRLAHARGRSRTLSVDGVAGLPRRWRRWETGTGSSMRSKPEVQRLSWSMLGWLNS